MYNPQEIAVYIHWPFCKSKCPYCDFYKEINPKVNQDEIISEYIKYLEYYHKLTADRTVKSIFFGGGTPSLIEPRLIEKIISFIEKKWKLKNHIEISLEANPNSNRLNMFSELRNAGINRLSLGVQSLTETNLRFLGRTHTAEQAKKCLQEVVKIFDNHSADLIYALPEQNLSEWEKELAEISDFGLKHISLYQLTIEENTVFARKNIKPLNEDEAANLYTFTCSFLHEKAYEQYEISNFAKKGFQSQHNLTYWEGGDYIGIGKSAHGRLFLHGNHIACEYPLQHTKLTAEERAEELIIMGLRLNKGINKSVFSQICGLNFTEFVNKTKFNFLKENHLLTETDTNVYATASGRLVLNTLIENLCQR